MRPLEKKICHQNKMVVPTLYHGSPFQLHELEPRVPRGETPFQAQKAVFLSSNKLEAQLYALARDPERKNKGWVIQDGVLLLRRDLWTGPNPKYSLNTNGYLHVFEGLRNVLQNPDLPSEWVSKEAVKPTYVEEVCLCDLPSQAIQYWEKEKAVRRNSVGFNGSKQSKQSKQSQKLKRRQTRKSRRVRR
jgi:hypothetical protein